MTMETIYITPEMGILEVQTEGVLCGSNEGLGESEGEW